MGEALTIKALQSNLVGFVLVIQTCSPSLLRAPSLAREVVFSSQIGAGVEFVDVVLHFRSRESCP